MTDLRRRKRDVFTAAHPELQRTALLAYKKAVRDGDLTRGVCAVCGSSVRVHGHHEDYAEPLNVTWLCDVHHHRRHRYGYTFGIFPTPAEMAA